jgi:hypothetical protein
MGVVMAPVAARRGIILDVDREDDDADIAVRPPMVREERAPEERRLSMMIFKTAHAAAAATTDAIEECSLLWCQHSASKPLSLVVERRRHFYGSEKLAKIFEARRQN